MANVLKVQDQDSITHLAAAGWSIRRISRQLGLDRKTVRRYLRAAPSATARRTPSKSPISTPGSDLPSEVVATQPEALRSEPGRPGHRHAHAEFISARLAGGHTAQRIYQDLVSEVGFTTSYQSVKRFVRRLRQAEPQRVWRLEVQPGEEAQVDFGSGAWVIDPTTGTRRRPWVLRVVLSFSRKAYSEAFFRQDAENFIRGLENAWRAFGGVPRTVNLDNLKAAVLPGRLGRPGPQLQAARLCQALRLRGASLSAQNPRTQGVGFILHLVGTMRDKWGLGAMGAFLVVCGSTG